MISKQFISVAELRDVFPVRSVAAFQLGLKVKHTVYWLALNDDYTIKNDAKAATLLKISLCPAPCAQSFSVSAACELSTSVTISDFFN